MIYRTLTISQDNVALHRALLRREYLNNMAARRKKKWQARRNALKRFFLLIKSAKFLTNTGHHNKSN